MTNDINTALLELILPAGILDYFTIVDFQQGDSGQYVYDKTLTLYLEEKDDIPEEYKTNRYKCSGFMEPRLINDCPIRSMLVTLHVNRRRWDVEIDGKKKKVSRDWNIVAQGTRMSAEYAAFLKEISRYNAISCQSLQTYLGVNGRSFQRQYKDQLSDYHSWKQREHAEQYIVYPKNLGPYLSIDETALSNGELYTIITNKARKGLKGSIVGMFKGTQSFDIIKLIFKNYPAHQRKIVREVTLDMAGSMNLIIKKCFPRAQRVTDRFHVQKLAYEAVQDIRIKHRWETLDEENKAYKQAKEKGVEYNSEVLANGDTRRQLLARSRYLLFKPEERWSLSQWERAQILFQLYPDIEKAYKLSYQLYEIYNRFITPDIARTRLAHWFNEIEESGFDAFATIRRTFETHHDTIINYFNGRSTNAAAESFNAKIKDFRRQFRGVVDIKFFLYRLCKIYA